MILAGLDDRSRALDPSRLELAKHLVAVGQEDALLPVPAGKSMLDGMESAARYIHWARHVGQFVVEGHVPWAASIRVPVLATLGTAESAPDLHAGLEAMRRRAVQAPRFDIQVIEGADHDYTRHEQKLAEVVAGWLDTLSGTQGAAKRHWWSR